MTGMPAASATVAHVSNAATGNGAGPLHGCGVAAGRLAGLADAAVVVADHAQPGAHEGVHLVGPPVEVIAHAVDQHQVLRAGPVDPVADFDSVAGDEAAGHRIPRSLIAVRQSSADARRPASTSSSSCSNA